jgi:hypothetical protein
MNSYSHGKKNEKIMKSRSCVREEGKRASQSNIQNLKSLNEVR